jgi:5-oxoprolinase (ATP-hydrolysing) subunit C
MIDVIRAGLLTTIQDLGRHGYRHLGVAMGGALDRLSLEVGNRLVGNRPDAAGLEITLGPTVLRFLRPARRSTASPSIRGGACLCTRARN